MLAFIVLLIVTFGFSLIPLWINKERAIWLNFLLSFSGSFLLGVTLLHIFPELYSVNSPKIQIGIFVMVGFFIQVILESYSKGIEHGHIHIHDFGKLPFGLFLALSLHATLEGSVLIDEKGIFDLGVIFAVLIHKLPVAFLLGFLLFSIKVPKYLVIILLLIFASATPIGAILTPNLNFEIWGVSVHSMFMAMATGSFLHVSTTILFETSPEHKLKINKFIPALLGGILAVLSAYFSH